MRLLVDTNVVSAVMHRLPSALDRLKVHQPGDLVLSSPVAAEIHFGLQRLPQGSRPRKNLEQEYRRIRELLPWRDWTEAAAVEFGRQKALLERTGQLIEDMDIAIGALAISLGVGVATYNTRHFGRLDGLEVADWGA